MNVVVPRDGVDVVALEVDDRAELTELLLERERVGEELVRERIDIG